MSETFCGNTLVASTIDENDVLHDTSVTSIGQSPRKHSSRTSSEDNLSIPHTRKETLYSDDLSNYNIPKREIPQDERLTRYCGLLTVPLEKLKSLTLLFQDELKRGLIAHKNHPDEWIEEDCSFKMVDSCVNKLPTGNEMGVYYAVDFGGTNLRAVRVELKGGGRVKRTEAKYSLKYEGPSGRDKGLLDCCATAKQLFDHFAERIRRVMQVSGDLESIADRQIPIGFTFSFPCIQNELSSARLVEWTKGFETGRQTNDPVEGQDVGRLLEEALQRNDVPGKLVAVLNDTVGTLLSCAYQKPVDFPDCIMGLILGTGSNGCYFERNSTEYGYKGEIINIEYGNFNRELPLTDIDVQLDWHTANRGHQLFEKMISGAYLGEIARVAVIRVFQHRAPINAWLEESLSSEDAARIVGDRTRDLSNCRHVLNERWSVGASIEVEDLRDIQQICAVVFNRSAALAAVSICAISRHTGLSGPDGQGLSCGIDGSLFVKNPWYAEHVRQHVKDIIGPAEAKKIFVVPADDGSGKGAAILAATIST